MNRIFYNLTNLFLHLNKVVYNDVQIPKKSDSVQSYTRNSLDEENLSILKEWSKYRKLFYSFPFLSAFSIDYEILPRY